jgi:hypothetical protein
MLILLLISAYVVCNLLIGVAFHMLSIVDIVAEPGTPELFVFFAVFAVAGLPILAVTLGVVAFSFLVGRPRSSQLETNGFYEGRSSSI